MPQRDASGVPVFNAMPPAVLLLAVPIVAVAILEFAAPELWRWIVAASLVVAVGPGATAPVQPLGPYAPLVLHVFIHFGLAHLAMNVGVLLGAGRPVGMAFGTGLRGTTGFLALFFICAIAGAGLDLLLHSGDMSTMGGASTGVSGLIAAVGWVTGGRRGMLRLAVPWILINIAIALVNLVYPIPIGWAAHIGGTLAGAVLTPAFIAIFGPRRPQG